MDYVLQQALDDVRKEMARENPKGAAAALTAALTTCEEESVRHIYFELGKLYFTTANPSNGIEMLCKAIENGYNSHIVSNYLLRLYYDYDKLYTRFHRNVALLEKYPNGSFIKSASIEEVDSFYLYCDNKYVLTVNKKKELFITTPKPLVFNEDTDNSIYCIINPLNVQQVSSIASLYPLLHKRRKPLYLLWQNMRQMLPFLTYTGLDSLLGEHRVEFLTGLDRIEKYFTDIQTFLPTHILDFTEEGQGRAQLQEVLQKRRSVTDKTKESVTRYYQQKQQELHENFKSGQIKLLLLASRFDEDGVKLINACSLACRRLQYKTASLSEKSAFSYNGSMEMLMLERTTPTAVLAFNSFRCQREDFPPEVLFVTFLSDLVSLQVEQWTPPLEMGAYDFVIASAADTTRLLAMGVQQRNIIAQPKVAGYFKQVPTAEEIKKDFRSKLFACDICLLCDYKSKASIISEMTQIALTSYPAQQEAVGQAFAEVDEKYLSLVFVGQLPLTVMRNMSILKEVLEKNHLDVSADLLTRLAETALHKLVPALYVTNLLKWLTVGGFDNIKIWGEGWLESGPYKKYYAGPVTDNGFLEKALSGAKIVVGQHLREADIFAIYSAVSCGCVYLSNEYFDKRETVQKELGLIPGEHVDYFSGKDSLLQKLRGYLDNPQSICDMAEKAKAAIRLEAVSEQVLKTVFDEIRSVL